MARTITEAQRAEMAAAAAQLNADAQEAAERAKAREAKREAAKLRRFAAAAAKLDADAARAAERTAARAAKREAAKARREAKARSNDVDYKIVSIVKLMKEFLLVGMVIDGQVEYFDVYEHSIESNLTLPREVREKLHKVRDDLCN